MKRLSFPPNNPLTPLALFAAVVLACSPLRASADDWPQWLGPQRDGVWRETGLLTEFPKDGLKVRWRIPVGSGYAGPAVAGGKVFVHDRVLDAGATNPDSGFTPPGSKVAGKERVLCLDEASGKVLWTHEYDCTYKLGYPLGPRCTPTVAGGKVYTLGAMGDLYCLDTADGKVRWSKNWVKDYGASLGIWGASAHPLVDGDKLICLVGGKGSVVVAFDKDTGKESWKALSAPEPGYAPPMIFTAGGKRQLIVWDPEAVSGLDPETGTVYWTQPFQLKPPSRMSISTPRYDDGLLFVTAFYDGSLCLKLAADAPKAEVLWKSKSKSEQPDRTDFLHSIISTPVFKDGYIYGVCSYGELRCLKADTGERLWSTRKATTKDDKPTRWANAFLVPLTPTPLPRGERGRGEGERFFLFNEQGELILARLSPKGYEEISRAKVLEPTNNMPGRPVVWSHPAFANKCVYARNDKEIVCVSLAK
jgi:outer membrane protein assembly factor BamB